MHTQMREMKVLPTVTLPLFSQARDMTPFTGRKTAGGSRDPELALLSASVSWEADPLCWSQSGSASWLEPSMSICINALGQVTSPLSLPWFPRKPSGGAVTSSSTFRPVLDT